MFLILPDLCGLFRPLHWSEFLHTEKQERNQRKKEASHLTSNSIYFSLFLSSLYLYYISFLFLHTTNASLLLCPPLFYIYLSPYIHCFVFLSFSVCFTSHIFVFIFLLSAKIKPFFERGLLLNFDLMSKKNKGVVLDSTASCGVSVCEDSKARFKYQTLMQDFQELQKEASEVKSKLEAVKKRKLMLTAEVRFLRQRYKCLVKTKARSSSQMHKIVQLPKVLKLHKSNVKDQIFSQKQDTANRLPPVPAPKPKKKHHIGEDFAASSASPIIHQHHKQKHGGKDSIRRSLTSISDIDQKGRIYLQKETVVRNATLFLDSNQKERLHPANDLAFMNSIAGFDLNLDNSRREASLPNRAPIFDLNEISTGDDDFESNGEALKLEEAKKGILRCLNDEQQQDLKLSICRNTGEGSSRVGKRKISWQDPVALRV